MVQSFTKHKQPENMSKLMGRSTRHSRPYHNLHAQTAEQQRPEGVALGSKNRGRRYSLDAGNGTGSVE